MTLDEVLRWAETTIIEEREDGCTPATCTSLRVALAIRGAEVDPIALAAEEYEAQRQSCPFCGRRFHLLATHIRPKHPAEYEGWREAQKGGSVP